METQSCSIMLNGLSIYVFSLCVCRFSSDSFNLVSIVLVITTNLTMKEGRL